VELQFSFALKLLLIIYNSKISI